MESSRTSLASRSSSRRHFEVLFLGLEGQVLGLEASSPRKLPCPRLGDSTFLEPLKFCWKTSKILRKSCEDPFLFSAVGDRLKNLIFFKTFFFENTCACVLRPWPRAFLYLASRGSVLGRAVLDWSLEPCVLDSTSDKSFSHIGIRVKLLLHT